MTDVTLEAVEIYPKILVYKNMFKDISKSYKILQDSLVESEDRLFSPWTQWSIFGDYINPIMPNFWDLDKYGNFKNIETKTQTQEDQKNFGIEMLENFHLVTADYAKRYDVDIDLKARSINEDGFDVPTWKWTGGTIGKYHISNENQKHGMRYHSDYMQDKAQAPGYKFIITCTIYFNDDYEGGEVDFVMGNKLVKYKPEAGDLLVFPSGHPDYLTEDGKPYLHGVMPAYKNHKFLSRMYWQKYEKASDEWYAKEKEFGKEVWASMQPELEQKFRDQHRQREVIENGERIR
jgi:hypothetical protein